ncbi:hypothetical protein LTR66_013149 [Elasticomyces elasticus]|nr:hypothetical protein LTR66_013149 [Elasticomyces elasticus]KAK4989869.1 hypothetical protein LTR50_002916 [Elasticomyces elasticus]KAK5010252.1 hypothetical protein LTR28_010988 [Elasticomyces elasticus]
MAERDEQVPCKDRSFLFNFEEGSFTNISNFQLQVQHTFKDPSMGPPPYDMVTNFARANVTSAVMDCWPVTDGTYCLLHYDITIVAPIWASIAKK